MKEFFALFLTACLLCAPALALAEAPTPTAQSGSGVLVAYFSCTGNTRPIAEAIAEGLGADLFEIVPETAYTESDLDYGDDESRTSIEQNDPDARPAIAAESAVEDMARYDVVFLGYPIWWGDAPRIISTFLESYDFSGKTIVPFCTSGSSGIGSSATDLEPLTEGAEWLEGRRFAAGTEADEVMAWVGSLGLFA